ncbi:MAG: thiol reductase thioredoxin [Candidatus Glassbacteria bacterium]|nr:thiol reductase thioredoxin [Candidatus Glassbacteria bacterium]
MPLKKPTLKVLTDENFRKEVLEEPGLVLVVFVADWCGLYRVIEPIIDQLAVDYRGRIKLGKVDNDQNEKTAAEYGVRNLPTLIFFLNGKIVDLITGVFPKKTVVDKLDSLLDKSDDKKDFAGR